MNARAHGILSSETLIEEGEGREDPELFYALAKSLRDDLAPDGALEELLVDQIIALTWRLRRVLRYENATLQLKAFVPAGTYVSWDREDLTHVPYSNLSELRAETGRLDERLRRLHAEAEILSSAEPLEQYAAIFERTFSIAEQDFDVDIEDVLRLQEEWDPFETYSRPQVARVVAAACKSGHVSAEEFWTHVREAVEKDVRDREDELAYQRRTRTIELLLAGLPPEQYLQRIQRYEAHLSREFYRALHELQRLQANRIQGLSAPPIAVDIEVASSTPDVG
jgi:hypothetical protein